MTDKNKNMMTMREAIDLARRGVSPRSIAAKAGMKLEVMMAYIQNHEEANRQFEEAQADYEIERVLAKDEIMNDPETDRALKIKIIREDLKTLGQWATASKPVILIDGGQVKAPDNAFNFQFVGMSDERKAAIKAETERTDSQQIDADPQDGNE